MIKIADRAAFPQEFRIRHDIEFIPALNMVRDRLFAPSAGLDRNSGLFHDQAIAINTRCDRCSHMLDPR